MNKSLEDLVNEAKIEIIEMEISVVKRKHEKDGAIIIDVREAEEFAAGHIPGASHISRGMMEFKTNSHPALKDKDAEIFVYCKSGGRAALAAHQLKKMGYTKVQSIKGGIDGWSAAKHPLKKG